MTQLSKSSSSQLPKDGKDSTSLSRQVAVLNSTQLQRLNGLISKGQRYIIGQDPKQLFNNGVSLSGALHDKRREVRIMLAAELTRLVRHVAATRTFQTEADIHDAVDDICEVFPSMKLDEILNCFKYIRRGHYELYGNFTINTLIECLRKYEMANTVVFREEEHSQRKTLLHTAAFDVRRIMTDLENDGKLKTSRRLLDRTHIPYPNDKTDAKTQSTEQHEETTSQTQRPETNQEGTADAP